ncbi:tryptophan 2,3-dioxygenase-like [Rhopilema esculentum]|uniref:tryptophan 2,3-dioxygenase-like n=1 Tax=Rhopilema esculentum TaxID=499914 RepID=UPI0031D64B22
MSCPFSNSASEIPTENHTRADTTAAKSGVTYGEYLQIEPLLECQKPLSDVHDEHLFIIVHQVYELWFKQIIHELDSVRKVFLIEVVDERNMLVVVSRLDRVVKILKVLVDQMMILETMTPLDFMEFRGKLAPASGFQSMQFRLLENKIGVKKENRIRYNRTDYKEIFKEVEKSVEIRKRVEISEEEPSLFDVVQNWLERTPGLEVDGFNFWKKFQSAFQCWMKDRNKEAELENDCRDKERALQDIAKVKEIFEQIFDERCYSYLLAKGDRRLSWKALQGALMIFFYRREVVFHQPFQFLNALMDIDSLLTKWRYNHVMLVQRQLGSKVGTGGTSGYQYLKSTVSDRYKVFLDLFNLSNYLIPTEYVPKLDVIARQRLNSCTASNGIELNGNASDF